MVLWLKHYGELINDQLLWRKKEVLCEKIWNDDEERDEKLRHEIWKKSRLFLYLHFFISLLVMSLIWWFTNWKNRRNSVIFICCYIWAFEDDKKSRLALGQTSLKSSEIVFSLWSDKILSALECICPVSTQTWGLVIDCCVLLNDLLSEK